MLDRITPLILTFNEAPNIARTLARLAWAREVVVLDSRSSDGTQEIAARHPNVRVLERPFTTHAEQWNFGLESGGISTEWVLALDADFVLSEELIQELRDLRPDESIAGYRVSFVYCVGGKPLRASMYPPLTVLFRKGRARYEQDGHTQRLRLEGEVRPLAGRIFHDDRKPFRRWLVSQVRYMRLEAAKLAGSPLRALDPAGRIRRFVVIAPPAMFLYCLTAKQGILDGRTGLYYAFQRTLAETILSFYMLKFYASYLRLS